MKDRNELKETLKGLLALIDEDSEEVEMSSLERSKQYRWYDHPPYKGPPEELAKYAKTPEGEWCAWASDQEIRMARMRWEEEQRDAEREIKKLSKQMDPMYKLVDEVKSILEGMSKSKPKCSVYAPGRQLKVTHK